MSNNKDFKVKNGIQPTVYHEGLGTVSVAGGVATLDLSTGSVFDYTPTSDVQVTLSNPADSGTVSGATLLLEGGGSTGYDLANANLLYSLNLTTSKVDLSVSFNSLGTKMYTLSSISDEVYQYSLSSAYNIATAVYDSVSLSVASQDTQMQNIEFKPDGTKMYAVGITNDNVYQYSLSTAFDLSTASYDSVSFSVAAQDTDSHGLAFSSDGTKMYIVGNGSDTAHQYTLSTAWDLSTASYASKSFLVSSQTIAPRDLAFNLNGTKMYICGNGTVSNVFQYSLSTAWDVSTASYDSISFKSSTDNPYGITFSSTGSLAFLNNPSGIIEKYSTATPATITYDTAIEWPSGTAPTSPAIGETDILTFNTTDGGTTYKAVLAIDGAV